MYAKIYGLGPFDMGAYSHLFTFRQMTIVTIPTHRRASVALFRHPFLNYETPTLLSFLH
jgi:hypothetical protein